ncbi:hypothetical protein [Nocardia abscessus]|uniref:hypothetical protein n=1 Tax=Nocardia abscessus TaxID=120957 RepID=UPI00245643FE|nr:hypothetical protein [Nocardia abscessus]
MAAQLARDLERIEELFEQLDVTITRTDVTRRPSADGVRGGGDEQPMLHNDRASERRRALHRELQYAAAHPPYALRARTPYSAASKILDDLEWTSRGPRAREWIERLSAVITRAWGCVDTAPVREFAGLCDHCGASVSGPSYLRVLTCPQCKAEHPAALMRQLMREAADECTGTAAELARLLPHFDGAPVKAATIRKWHERGRLMGCVTPRGITFRIGDVRRLHRAQQQRVKLRPVPTAA